MAHVDRNRKVEVKRKTEPAVSPVERPDWVLSGLAAAGMLVAAYLTWLKLSGSGAALCVAGSGCDIVQASRYATFLWVPTALWGLVTYVAIGVLAWIGLTPRNWPIAFALAAGGVGFSAYLTWLSVFDLGATCVWCLTSAVILIAILAVLVMRRPSGAEPEAGDELRPARHVRRARCRGRRRRRRLRVCRSLLRSAGLSIRARASPRRHESGDVRRVLVTGVPRAKGPVRARGEGYPVCGVRPEGRQSPARPLPASGGEVISYLGRQWPDPGGSDDARSTRRDVEVPLRGEGREVGSGRDDQPLQFAA